MHAYRLALTIVGVICLIAAVIHALWLWYMPNYAALATLDALQIDTILLLNAAITLFLLVMAVATFLVARATTLSLQHVRAFALLLMGFWVGRFLLELVMPLQIPLLFIERPAAFAKVFMALPVIVLAVPFLIGRERHGLNLDSSQ